MLEATSMSGYAARVRSQGLTEARIDTKRNNVDNFDVLLTVHLGIFSHNLTNLMHKISFIMSLISCLYMFRAHALIIRRSKLHYTASGIITPIGVMIQDAV